ncbi:lysophospholipid acyltransferase family protein [Shimia thalassica]|uniref:lysophospholipid acyltransferase family protein n=1 Tax=Shimia thalassica TaxID=1715693 RepID=UPI003EB7CD2E
MPVSLRKKIADSQLVQSFATTLFELYVRFCHVTSRWERVGFEPMEEAVQTGEAVIVAIWHQRLMMSPYIFDTSLAPICSLTSDARAGRLAGDLQRRFGFDSISMNSRTRHVVASREILKRIRNGVSIGIASDGPRGPARVCSTVPIVWARSSGKRVFTVSFSQKRVIALPTWDEMWLPTPFSKGVFLCKEWKQDVPRKADDETYETLRLDLEKALEEITAASDKQSGRG